MKGKITSTKYIELYFDEKTLIYSWKFLPATEEIDLEEKPLKEIFILMMSAMKEYKPKLVLADDRENFATFAIDMQNWIGEITSEAFKACGTERFAVVLPEDIINSVATDQTMDGTRKKMPNMEIEAFSSIEDAKVWLLS